MASMSILWRTLLSAAVLAAVAAGPRDTYAQTRAKPSRCLTAADVKTEQLVRHGIFLREAGNRCDEWVPGTRQKWLDFDGRFGTRLRSQTDRRIRMFQRAFRDDAVKVMTYFDGRLVTYHRHYPLSEGYCRNVDELLDEVRKRGWGGFTKQAEVIQNEVHLDYKVCQ